MSRAGDGLGDGIGGDSIVPREYMWEKMKGPRTKLPNKTTATTLKDR